MVFVFVFVPLLPTTFPISQSHLGTAINVLQENWISIAVTIGVAILTVYSTNRLVRKLSTNARQERYSQAKGELIRMLEEHVINDKEVTPIRIENLLAAVEREHSVDLSTSVSKVSLLQDLQYNIEDSTHLSTKQKKGYSEEIELTIDKIKESKNSTPQPFDEVINELEKNIENGNKDEALSYIEDLETSVKELTENNIGQTTITHTADRMPLIIGTAVITIAFFSTSWLVPDTYQYIGEVYPLVVLLVVSLYGFSAIIYTYIELK